jgi:hypothetical protein
MKPKQNKKKEKKPKSVEAKVNLGKWTKLNFKKQ